MNQHEAELFAALRPVVAAFHRLEVELARSGLLRQACDDAGLPSDRD